MPPISSREHVAHHHPMTHTRPSRMPAVATVATIAAIITMATAVLALVLIIEGN